jgi:hypothetical protein
MTRIRSAARFVVSVVIISIAFTASPAPAGACSCAGFDDADAFAEADAVFIASVDRVYPARSGASDNPEVAIVHVSDVFKGTADEFQGTATPESGASCGFDFVTDEVYVVFASQNSGPIDLDDGFYGVDLCGGTRLIAERDLMVDSPSTLPEPGGPPSDAAIRAQLGDPRSSLFPEAFIFVSVLAFILGLAAVFSRRDQRRVERS